jgi:hypothetical protein
VNRDFVEMLSALSAAGAEFLIVGAHALASHGVVRATGDLDIWVRPTAENSERVWAALTAFGAPLDQITLADLHTPDIVFQIGVSPNRIDLLTSISGVEFDRAWKNSVPIEIGGTSVRVIGKRELIENKRATARPRDLADIYELERESEAE